MSPSAVSPAAVKPAAVKPAAARPSAARRGVGRPRVNLRPRARARCSAIPTAARRSSVTIRKRILNTIKSTWGGRRYRSGVRATRRTAGSGSPRGRSTTGDRAGALPGPQARRERPGARGQGPQQGHGPWKWLRKHLPHTLYRKGHPETRQPVELRPALPGLLPRQRRHGPLEVLPVLQRRRLPRAHDHDADLDEPDRDGLPGPVEPRDDHLATWRVQGVHQDLRRVAARPARSRNTYRDYRDGPVQSIFFPRPGTSGRYDPVMRALGKLFRCKGTTGVGTGCTARRSGSSSTRSTTAAASGSPSGSSGCGTQGCNVKDHLRGRPAVPCSPSCGHARGAARCRCGSR